MIVAKTKNHPEATEIATGDVVAIAPWVAVVEEVGATMIDVAEEDMIVAVEEDTIVLTMIVIEILEVSTEEAVTTTIEMVSIEEVAVEAGMTTIMIAAVADLIHFGGVGMIEVQHLVTIEALLLLKREVPVVPDLDFNLRRGLLHYQNNRALKERRKLLLSINQSRKTKTLRKLVIKVRKKRSHPKRKKMPTLKILHQPLEKDGKQ